MRLYLLIFIAISASWARAFPAEPAVNGAKTAAKDSAIAVDTQTGSYKNKEFADSSATAINTAGKKAAGEDTLLANSGTLPGTVQAEAINIRGQLSLLLSVVAADGAINRECSGIFPLLINDKREALQFSQGYAVWPLSGTRFESLRLEYKSLSGPKTSQYGFHTRGIKTRQQTVVPWTSMLPPLLVIVLVLVFHEVIGALLAGIFFGALLLLGFQPQDWFFAITGSIEYFLAAAVTDHHHARILILIVLMSALSSVIYRNGGLSGMAEKLGRVIRSSRNAQLATWLLSLSFFYDDFASILVTGNSMRPITDRFHVSREKLAYLVNAAVPVVAFALVSTWIGGELDAISGAITGIDVRENAYGVFLQALPLAYYPLFTLVFVGMIILMKRDFGAMYRAETQARYSDQPSALLQNSGSLPGGEQHDRKNRKTSAWYNAFFPLLTFIVMTMAGLWQTGLEGLRVDAHEYATFWDHEVFSNRIQLFFSSDLLVVVLGKSEVYPALIWAASSGLFVAVAFSLFSRSLSLSELPEAVLRGLKMILPTLAILVLAWALNGVTGQLHTGAFLTSILNDQIPPQWLPAVAFCLAGLIAFFTGSSRTAMAVFLPVVLPLTSALGLTAGLPGENILAIFYQVTAMVLAGSVFGEQCSPFSTSTILSSLASDCDHAGHVHSQWPYALCAGAVTFICGAILPVPGSPFWLNFLVGVVLLFLLVRIVGKEVHNVKTSRSQTPPDQAAAADKR